MRKQKSKQGNRGMFYVVLLVALLTLAGCEKVHSADQTVDQEINSEEENKQLLEKIKTSYINYIKNNEFLQISGDAVYAQPGKMLIEDVDLDGQPELLLVCRRLWHAYGGNGGVHTYICKYNSELDTVDVVAEIGDLTAIADQKYLVTTSYGSEGSGLDGQGNYIFYNMGSLEQAYEVKIYQSDYTNPSETIYQMKAKGEKDYYYETEEIARYFDRSKISDIQQSAMVDTLMYQQEKIEFITDQTIIKNYLGQVSVTNMAEIENVINQYQIQEFISTGYYDEGNTVSDEAYAALEGYRNYLNTYIQNNSKASLNFEVLDIDSDRIPELILYPSIVKGYMIMGYTNGQVKEILKQSSSDDVLSIVEGEPVIINNSLRNGIYQVQYYSIANGEATDIGTYYSNAGSQSKEKIYKINEVSVSESEYNSSLKQMQSKYSSKSTSAPMTGNKKTIALMFTKYEKDESLWNQS